MNVDEVVNGDEVVNVDEVVDANAVRQTLRQNILSATRNISELAKTGAWHQTLELVNERQGLLETFFSANGECDNEAALIHEVLKADRLLAAMASAVRQQTLTELDGQRHMRKALGAYAAES